MDGLSGAVGDHVKQVPLVLVKHSSTVNRSCLRRIVRKQPRDAKWEQDTLTTEGLPLVEKGSPVYIYIIHAFFFVLVLSYASMHIALDC